ncbi:MAG: sulfur carrier protein ThiS [Planctomycetota bacterium]|nr:MAG: sulfur carrier protein ThiS [Planctomycetota bacterium]
MHIEINDKTMELSPGATVEMLLQQLGHGEGRGIAVAVNDQVHPRSGWSQQTLNDGDRVTLIRAAAGG